MGIKYKTNLSPKGPSEFAKVKVLEEAVQKGTLEYLQVVIDKYKNFEMTARALGLAARYRGMEFVKVLANNNATFNYNRNGAFQRKYKMTQKAGYGYYWTDYCFMIVPEKLNLTLDKWGNSSYKNSGLCGVHKMNIVKELVPLSLEKRIEIAKYFIENKDLEASMDGMLYWALTNDELVFADALIDMGVNLNDMEANYCERHSGLTYLDIITSAIKSKYRSTYVESIIGLKEEKLLPVLERFDKLAKNVGKKLFISQRIFDYAKWNRESLSYVFKNADISKINKKKTLENAVSNNDIEKLEIMAEGGWLRIAEKREGLIDFARENGYEEALSWLIDFKNRTVDLALEKLRVEAKMFKELMEDPDSVSAMKKKWTYKKQENNTLQITSYKGDEEHVEIPSMIGRVKVTSIGREAFSARASRIKNADNRRKIKSVIIPEGVKEVGESAFSGCESIETIKVPKTVKKIDEYVFEGCSNLKEIVLPQKVKTEKGIFSGCLSLCNEDGLIILDDVLYGWKGLKQGEKILVIPEGITKIAKCGLSHYFSYYSWDLKEIVLPDGLLEIGEAAFKGIHLEKINIPDSVIKLGKEAFAWTNITEIRIPKGVKSLPAELFLSCNLKKMYIPGTVEKIGRSIFGQGSMFNKITELYVYTPSGSAVEEYMKNIPGVYVLNDYTE